MTEPLWMQQCDAAGHAVGKTAPRQSRVGDVNGPSKTAGAGSS